METDFKYRFNSHTKSFNLKQYQNEAIQKTLDYKTQTFHTKSCLENKRKCAPFNKAKRELSMSQWKDLLVSSYEGDNLLNKVQNLLISSELCSINCLLRTSVDIKTSSPFCSMIARTKSCIFTGIFFAVFPSTQSFLSARLMFWLLSFPK